ISPAALPAVFCALSSAGLPAIVALRLAAVLVARLVAPLLLPRAPLVERRAASLALAAVIAVMAPPCVGAKAHAHHQHRRKQHARCPHEWPPRWSCNAHKNARGAPRVRLASLEAESQPHVSPAGLTMQVGFIRLAYLKGPNSGKPEFGWSIALRMDGRVKPGHDGCSLAG